MSRPVRSLDLAELRVADDRDFSTAFTADAYGRELLLRGLDEILHWSDPGPGGFYDELGNPRCQPHLVRAERQGDREPQDGRRHQQDEVNLRASWQ